MPTRACRATGDEVHTGQVFFREAAQRKVYAQGHYAARGDADTSDATDMIYGEAGSRALLTLRRRGERIAAGHTGSLVVGVNPS